MSAWTSIPTMPLGCTYAITPRYSPHLTNEVLPGQVFLAFHFRVGVLVFVGSSGPSGDVVS